MLKTGMGVLIIEATMSNPNGDPDNGGAPRIDPDGFGLITDVSVKRKFRDIVADKASPLWQELAKKLSLPATGYDILEDPSRSLAETKELLKKENGCQMFHNQFVDARLFGNTFLEEGTKSAHVRTGVVIPCIGRSVAPVEELRMTCTKRKAVQEGKDRGMAPDRIKVIRHGIYCMDFSVDYVNAHRTWCSQLDIDLFLACIPYIYAANKSTARMDVRVLSAPYIEFKGLGTKILDIQKSFHPVRKGDKSQASTSRDDYDFPVLKNDLVKKFESDIIKIVDLCE